MGSRLERFALNLFIFIGILWVSLKLWDIFFHRDVAPKPVTARGTLAGDEQNTIDVFYSIKPSVVSITTSRQVKDFWRRQVDNVPAGSGSGFIWDGKGHIVTNFHVIQNATSAIIRLNDNREYEALLIGVSPENDLAVLRIKVEFQIPPAVAIGTSEDLQVGQNVFAIGNPFGLDYTLTRGIVSALDRSISGENSYRINHLIQTDAAINPGNSGGPLIDSAGRVVGITTAIFSPSGTNAGIGFAIPIDTVNRVVPELIKSGHYKPLKLGVGTDKRVNQLVKIQLGISGVVVLEVEPGSIADKLGVQTSRFDSEKGFILGDIITHIDNSPVTDGQTINQLLDNKRDISSFKISIIRNGKIVTLIWTKLDQTQV